MPASQAGRRRFDPGRPLQFSLKVLQNDGVSAIRVPSTGNQHLTQIEVRSEIPGRARTRSVALPYVLITARSGQISSNKNTESSVLGELDPRSGSRSDPRSLSARGLFRRRSQREQAGGQPRPGHFSCRPRFAR